MSKITYTPTNTWLIGDTVSVGFLRLVVYKLSPSGWILRNPKGDKFYEFTPYCGIHRVYKWQG